MPNSSPAPAATEYPQRVGAIDIGSNGIRLRAALFTAAGQFELLEEGRAPVRLGAEAFDTGRFSTELLDDAVAAIAEHRAALGRLGVRRYRCVATSAVRESENGSELVERVAAETGIALEVIDGAEEARLVWVATRLAVDLGTGSWLLVDLGGGSVEISLVSREEVFWSVTHPMGAVRLLQEMSGAAKPAKKLRKLLDAYARDLGLDERLAGAPVSGMIATGGNIDELAILSGAPADAAGVVRPSLRQLKKTRERLSGIPLRRRISKLGLRPDRADVIVPAAAVYIYLAKLAGVRSVVVPRVGVKEGVLLDLATNPDAGRLLGNPLAADAAAP